MVLSRNREGEFGPSSGASSDSKEPRVITDDPRAAPGSDPGYDITTNQLGLDWQVTGYDYNSLSLLTRSEEHGLLYWADGYDPYWRVYLDGIEAPLHKANINFKAVRLPKPCSA